MSEYAPSIEKLIERFERLPSIGHKTAARLAFHVLDWNEKETNEFVSSIITAKKNLKYCSKCYKVKAEEDRNPYSSYSSTHLNSRSICLPHKRGQVLLLLVLTAVGR